MTIDIEKLASASQELVELREAYAGQKRKASELSEQVMRDKLVHGELERKLGEMETLRAERDSLRQQLSESASHLKTTREALARAEREAAEGKAAQETLRILGGALEKIGPEAA